VGTRLIIDGDVLCHLACRYDRWQTKVKQRQDRFVIQVGEDGRNVPPSYDKETNERYMRESWANFERMVNKLMEKFFTTDMLMAVKSSTNFRDDIFSGYKAPRKRAVEAAAEKAKAEGGARNTFVSNVRKLAVAQGLAVEAVGMEADDYVRIWAEECIAAGQDFVVVSIDKDLKCIPGKYYNPQKKTLETVTQEYATRFFYEQLLMGDQADNIPGVPGVGPITAVKALAEFETEGEFQEQVAGYYMHEYADEWAGMLLMNGKLLYILKTLDDVFTIDDWPIYKELG